MPELSSRDSLTPYSEFEDRSGSWLCENAEARNGNRMNTLRNRILVRKDSSAQSVSLDWRKTILVTSQFFASLHGLGQYRPNEAIAVGSGSHPTPDMLLRCTKRRFGPISDIEMNAFGSNCRRR